MQKAHLSSFLQLHLIVLIYGFTAILGKLISLPALELVWYRMLIAIIAFFVYLKLTRAQLGIDWKTWWQFFGVGGIIAIHWVTFYGAIKLSNVSVTLGCFATTALFTSFLEPFFYKRKVAWLEVITGLVIIAGLYLIFRFETHYATGIAVALLSAFLAGLFTVLNKKLVAGHKPVKISFYEMIGGFIFLTMYELLSGRGFHAAFAIPGREDLFWLLLLGTICTAYAHTVQTAVMRHLTAFTVSLTINLEPVYGIILAVLMFGETEKMTFGFYAGTLIILISVIGYPLLRYFTKK